MSLFRREIRALPTNLDPYQVTARPFFNNWSGEVVTETNAFANSAVLSCISVIADSIATMPLELYRERNGVMEEMPTPSVLVRPNAMQSTFEFIHEAVATLALHGCVYIYAPHNIGELPSEMRVIHPHRVRMKYDDALGLPYYLVGDERYEIDEVRGIHWLLLAGQSRGVSPLEAQRNTIGTALAMDRFLSQFYGEGATPSSVLESDKPITPEQAQVLRDTWEESHWKRRRPAVLSNGLRWRSITTSAADMQMLEHKESITRDIARVYRVPLHLISGTGGDSMTYQNMETMGTNFVRFTLLPWMRRVEDALSEMLPITQRVRFNADEFLRADLLTRVRAQQIQIMNGTLTPNEARADDNREPYEGGDQFIIGIAGAPMSSIEGGDLPLLGTDAQPPER